MALPAEVVPVGPHPRVDGESGCGAPHPKIRVIFLKNYKNKIIRNAISSYHGPTPWVLTPAKLQELKDMCDNESPEDEHEKRSSGNKNTCGLKNSSFHRY